MDTIMDTNKKEASGVNLLLIEIILKWSLCIIHKKVDPSKCACLPAGRDFGMRSADLLAEKEKNLTYT